MSIETARTTVFTVVSGVTDIGKVHKYRRWSNQWDDFLNMFKTTINGVDQIRGAMVGYSGTGRVQNPLDFGLSEKLRQLRFGVHMYMRVNDELQSEIVASNLVESVMDALDTSSTLHDGVSFYETTLAECVTFEERVFGSVLCHYGELVLAITEVKNG